MYFELYLNDCGNSKQNEINKCINNFNEENCLNKVCTTKYKCSNLTDFECCYLLGSGCNQKCKKVDT